MSPSSPIDAYFAARVAAGSVLAAASLVTAGALLVRRTRPTLPLAAVFVAVALCGLTEVANVFGAFHERPLLSAIAVWPVYMLPPLVYIAVRAFADLPPAGRRHLVVPMLAVVAFALVYESRARGWGLMPLAAAKRLSLVLFTAYAGAYLIACARMAFGESLKLRELFAHHQGAPSTRQRRLVMLFALPWVFLLLELAVGSVVDLPQGARLGFASARVAGFVALAVVSLQPAAWVTIGSAPEVARRPYARSRLRVEQATRLEATLRDTMTREHLYRDPFLALSSLADRLGCTEHKLSQLLSERLGCSFFDYVNRHRVIDACRRLRTDASVTILSVATEVGFNSKSTFNVAFKKHVGVTPSEFRRDPAIHTPITYGPVEPNDAGDAPA